MSTALTIAVDFDSTIAMNSWPRITKDTELNTVVADWIRKHQAMGDRIVLWTSAGVNRHPDETPGDQQSEFRQYGRKICVDAYIDDRSVPFCPKSKLMWKVYLWLMDRKLEGMRK